MPDRVALSTEITASILEKGTPTVVAGDFNAVAYFDEIQKYTQYTWDSCTKASFTDPDGLACFILSGDGKLIDYVFYRGSFLVESYRRLSGDAVFPSDHPMLVVKARYDAIFPVAPPWRALHDPRQDCAQVCDQLHQECLKPPISPPIIKECKDDFNDCMGGCPQSRPLFPS